MFIVYESQQFYEQFSNLELLSTCTTSLDKLQIKFQFFFLLKADKKEDGNQHNFKIRILKERF